MQTMLYCEKITNDVWLVQCRNCRTLMSSDNCARPNVSEVIWDWQPITELTLTKINRPKNTIQYNSANSNNQTYNIHKAYNIWLGNKVGLFHSSRDHMWVVNVFVDEIESNHPQQGYIRYLQSSPLCVTSRSWHFATNDVTTSHFFIPATQCWVSR